MSDLADEDLDRPTPDALDAQPDLPAHLGRILDAFWMLSRSRRVIVGMESSIILPIEVSEALAMAGALEWDALDFLRVIRPADDLYVEQMNRRKAS